jgi:hypothetical protein
MLKMYGDAEVTVSTEMFSVAPETDGSGSTGAFWTSYSNSNVVPEETTLEITY